jgi:hypothetical protein
VEQRSGIDGFSRPNEAATLIAMNKQDRPCRIANVRIGLKKLDGRLTGRADLMLRKSRHD